MSKDTLAIIVVILVCTGGLLGIELMAGSGGAAATAETYRSIALELYNQALYEESAAFYDRYLAAASLDATREANVHFQVGKIFEEKLQDYEAAMARYITAKQLAPESGLTNELNSRMVTCLERMDRSIEASAMLRESTKLSAERDESDTGLPGAIVAEIGDTRVTMGDYQQALNDLDPRIRQTIDSPEKKFEFLRSLVARKVLAGAAKRKGLDKDEEVRRQLEQVEQDLMVQRLMRQEVEASMDLTAEDLELYYRANRERYSAPSERTTAHLLVDSEEEAAELLEELRGGASWDELVEAHSLDNASKGRGGVLGDVSQEGPVPGLGNNVSVRQAAFSTPVGSYSEPVESGIGWHIVYPKSETPGEPIPFNQVAEQVQQDMTQERAMSAQESMMQRYMEAEDVKLHEQVFFSRLDATPLPASASE